MSFQPVLHPTTVSSLQSDITAGNFGLFTSSEPCYCLCLFAFWFCGGFFVCVCLFVFIWFGFFVLVLAAKGLNVLAPGSMKFYVKIFIEFSGDK